MEKKEHRLAVIMFTDIQGFSRMLEQNETETIKIMEFHNRTVRELVAAYQGEVIKSIGDAFMCSFTTTLEAVRCAITVLEKIADFNRGREKSGSTELSLNLRIGIHLGDIYFYENDALGEGINIASRLQGLCKPGRICLSGEVYNQVYNKLDVRLENLGNVELKNISRKIQAYEIILQEDKSLETKQDEKAEDSRIETYLNENRAVNRGTGEKMEFDEVKEFVIGMIKKAGRRLPAEKIKKNLGGFFSKLDNVLDQLVEKGYLTKLDKDDGSINYGVNELEKINNASCNWQNKWEEKLQEKMDRWEQRYNRRAYKREMIRKYRHHKHDHHDHDWELELITDENYKEHLQQAIEEAGRAKAGLAGHFVSYVIVNAFIIFLNFRTGVNYPFFLYPLAGWGIGLLSHISEVFQKGRAKKELERVQDHISKEQYTLIRKYQKKRQGFFSHIISSLAVSALLMMIFILHPTSFFWPVFPIGGLAIGMVSHLATFLVNRSSTRKKLKQWLPGFFRKGKTLPRSPVYKSSSTAEAGIVEKAIEIKNVILNQLKSFRKGESPLGEDIKPVLDDYIEQIRILNRKNDELAEFMQSLSASHIDLEKDLVLLKKKYEQSSSESLKLEYKKSIEEIERQHKSIADLKNQKEILNLRLNSSLNALSQMQIDLVRMKGVPETGDRASVTMLKDKTKELSQYIEDLKAGYTELDE